MDKIKEIIKAIDDGRIQEYILKECERYSDTIANAIGPVAQFEIPAVIFTLRLYLDYFEKNFETESRVADDFNTFIKTRSVTIKTRMEEK